MVCLIWCIARRVDRLLNTTEIIENKAITWYIITGEVRILSQ